MIKFNDVLKEKRTPVNVFFEYSKFLDFSEFPKGFLIRLKVMQKKITVSTLLKSDSSFETSKNQMK